MRIRNARSDELRVTNEVARKPGRKHYTTKLFHPSFSIEPCPNCEFPEADGGYCEECGWSRPDPRQR